MNITYGSVCSGIESASMAWEPLGMTAEWFSEIEPFPCAVLAHRWPNVPNLGDMTLLPNLVRMGLVKAPNILVGGTPCQAFSVAGNRESLNDHRGQLTLTYVDLANAIDEQRPDDECVVTWENVPGVLNTADNAFGCFLGELAGSGCELFPPTDKPADGKSTKLWRWDKKTKKHRAKWSNAGCVFGPQRTVAWRFVDAQYFGVPQRRKRVFVVASSRNGFDPCKVLFEFEGVRRDIAPSRETRENITSGVEKCFTPSSFAQYSEGVGTLRSQGGDLGGGSEGLISRVVHGTQDPVTSGELSFSVGRNNGAENVIWPAETAATLNASFGDKQGLEDQHALGGASWFVPGVVQPIHDKTTRHAGQTGRGSGNGFGVGKENDPMFTLTTGDKHSVSVNNAVRRLTPVECERLQGFPDNHTRIPYRNKSVEDCPDGPRYKTIGNSKAVPCIKFIGVRIMLELMGLL